MVVLDAEVLHQFDGDEPHFELGQPPADAHARAEAERQHQVRVDAALEGVALDPALGHEAIRLREVLLHAAHVLVQRRHQRLLSAVSQKDTQEKVNTR